MQTRQLTEFEVGKFVANFGFKEIENVLNNALLVLMYV